MPSASSVAELAAVLREARGPVRPRGGGTKLGWGAPPPADAIELDTTDRPAEDVIAQIAGLVADARRR